MQWLQQCMRCFQPNGKPKAQECVPWAHLCRAGEEGITKRAIRLDDSLCCLKLERVMGIEPT